jgi:hypothetical protein
VVCKEWGGGGQVVKLGCLGIGLLVSVCSASCVPVEGRFSYEFSSFFGGGLCYSVGVCVVV